MGCRSLVAGRVVLVMLARVALLTLAACGRDPAPSRPAAAATHATHATSARPATPATTRAPDGAGGPALPAHRTYADLGAALRGTIPDDARVIGVGELHARVDRAPVRSALAAFTVAMPAIADRISDLVVETWIVNQRCGQAAVAATKRVETEVKRPVETKSEIALLADAARTAQVQPHAMTVTCKDYETLADPVAMLTLTTRELTRIATSAVHHRDREPTHRPWIAIYGGALHNDRFPAEGVAEWSYASAVDEATGGHFVELDLIVPELAEADEPSHKEPWYPLAKAARSEVAVWTRGERSFVVILPRGR